MKKMETNLCFQCDTENTSPSSQVTSSSEHVTSCIQTPFFLPFLAVKEGNTSTYLQLIQANETCSDFWSCVLNFTHSISSRSPQTWGSVAQTAILEPQPLHLWLQASLHWHWKQSKIWVILQKKKLSIRKDLSHWSSTFFQGSQKCFGNFVVVIHSTLPRAGKIHVLISHARKLTPWKWQQSTQCWNNLKQCWA